MKRESVIGQSLWRREAADKVTGRAVYPQDIYLPGMVFGRTLRAACPRAKIIRLDYERAARMPGVLRIFSAADVPGHSAHGVLKADMPVFARDEVRSVNDALLLVVAETSEQAAAALEQVRVEYDEMPAVFDPLAAMRPEAPKVWPEGNVAYHLKIRKGDVQLGFRESRAVVTETFHTPMVDQAFLQPEAGVASVDERGHVVLQVATQYPHWDRTEISRCLGWEEERVRVVTTTVGGAFGGREDMTLQIHACLAAAALQRPVKIVYDRQESFIAHSKRHPMVMEYRLGADQDGLLTALEARIVGDAGAYLSWSPNILRKAAVHAAGPYKVPHVQVDSYAVHTNNPFTGAMRGFGAAQTPLAYESLMDMLAERLGIHPFVIRYRNAVVRGDETITGQVLDMSVGMKQTLEQAAQQAGWDVESLLRQAREVGR